MVGGYGETADAPVYPAPNHAEVAKLATALALGASARKSLWVRVPPSAHHNLVRDKGVGGRNPMGVQILLPALKKKNPINGVFLLFFD